VNKIVKVILLSIAVWSLGLYAEEVKIMPLGDSITWDWYYGDARAIAHKHGYRNHLWYKLQNAKYDVDFVGTRHNGSAISPSFDGDNEGETGLTTHQIASFIYSKLQATSPDIILLHIGTNDSMSYAPSDMTGLEKILNQIDLYEKNYHKNITVILARIIPLPKAGSWVTTFNSALDGMVANRISDGDNIVKVNMNTISSLIDGIHPTNTGYQQMANIWFNALKIAVIPSIPTHLTTSKLETNSATLSWKDTSQTEDGFKIYRGAVLIATLPANSTKYTLHNLESRTTYTYTIVAYSKNGNAKGQNIIFTTKDDYAYLIPVYGLLLQ